MDRCEWKTRKRIDSGFNQVRYNIIHTELIRRCTDELEQRSLDFAEEYQNKFPFKLQGAIVSSGPDMIATRGDEVLIVDVKNVHSEARPTRSRSCSTWRSCPWPTAGTGT